MAAPAGERGGRAAVAAAGHVAGRACEGLFLGPHGRGRAAARPRRGDRIEAALRG